MTAGMSDPVNLNKFRKAKAKAEKAQRAKENRAKFGQPKSVKKLEAAKTEKQARDTEAHRLRPGDSKDS